MHERFARHEDLFGAVGQQRLADITIGIVGAGGLGSHVAQQLAYLGVYKTATVDDDVADDTSLNRLIGATEDDVGRLKVDIAADMTRTILPEAETITIGQTLEHADSAAALSEVDLVIGCLDRDLARLHLIELTCKAGIPMFDLATDVVADGNGTPTFGGRVLFSGKGERCAYCMGELDQDEIRHATMSAAELGNEAQIYGVPVTALAARTGPSVVSVNGVIASLAVTEAMKLITDLGAPAPILRYIGNTGIVRRVTDSPVVSPCPYCSRWGSTS